MPRKTMTARILLERLADYLGAEVEGAYGTYFIFNYGADTQPLPTEGPEAPVGMNAWTALGRLLFVASLFEEVGGGGCSWAGMLEAMAPDFHRECPRAGCNVRRPAGQPCPQHPDELGGDLVLPSDIDATTDAMLCRLAEAEFFDALAEATWERRYGAQEVADA